MTAYYNEFDPKAAVWLRELIRQGHIAPGDVDERSIADVRPDDLRGYTQCHFFAGIGVWSYALRRAGWPDDRPVWTGSAPCQPFSAAGRGEGSGDDRHLWPEFYRLIRAHQPPVVFGEQVSSSLAVGKPRDENVRGLWDRQATLRLLALGMEELISEHLQDMQERDSAGTSRIALHEYRFAGEPLGGWREGPGDAEGPAVRSDDGVGAGAPGSWHLRGNGHSVQLLDEAGLEHAVAGSDRAIGRLHAEEHPPHTIWLERGIRELGRAADDRDGVGHLAEAAREIAGAVNSTWRSIEAADGWSWLNTLQADLEDAGYAVGAVDLCAAGVGAPHIRQRLWWVGERLANAGGDGRGECPEQHSVAAQRGQQAPLWDDDAGRSFDGRLALPYYAERRASSPGGHVSHRHDPEWAQGASDFERPRRDGGLADTADPRRNEAGQHERGSSQLSARPVEHGGLVRSGGPVNGLWRAADWLYCRDGKWRPVEPGTFPLAHGAPERVGLLRGYGNAIVAPAAQAFIEAYLEAEADRHLQLGGVFG